MKMVSHAKCFEVKPLNYRVAKDDLLAKRKRCVHNFQESFTLMKKISKIEDMIEKQFT